MRGTLNFLGFSLFLMLFVFAIGCNKDDNTVDPELEVSLSEISTDCDGCTQSFNVITNTTWTVSSSADWCQVSPESGSSGTNTVEVDIEANTSTDGRTAYLTVEAGSLSEQITITEGNVDVLSLSENSYEVDAAGGDIDITATTTGDFSITTSVDWIEESELKSTTDSTVTFTVSENTSLYDREGYIVFTYNDLSDTAYVTQDASSATIDPDETGMTSDAMTLASYMEAGWNIGNSLEVPDGETAWGNPKVNQALIDSVKAAGFNAIRIPCAWDAYIVDEDTYEVDEDWFARVKEVVDYCYNNDMYVILNIHWDNGWLEEHPTYDYQDAVNEEQSALWKQIAVYFRDYDEHLLFAGTNEVHETDYSDPDDENIEVQESYIQTFVNSVRRTGGKNYYRNLIVQTYNTSIDYGYDYQNMPTDTVEDRLMVEIHYYSPWDFCGATEDYKTQWGEGYTDVSTWGQEDYLISEFEKMKTKYVDNNIPVVMGEYGALLRTSLQGVAYTNHVESRNYFLKTVTATAKEDGIIPFIWDNGTTGDNGFGLFDRDTGEQVHSDAISAIIEGAQ